MSQIARRTFVLALTTVVLGGCQDSLEPLRPVASVTVAPAMATVEAGQTVQLTATIRDAHQDVLTGREVIWASGDPAVATVSATGLVTGVVAGRATITATSEGQSGTAAIAVTP